MAIPLKDYDHVVLRVHDLERMVAFYTATLGCTVDWRRPELGLVHLRAGSAMLDLVPVAGEIGKRGGKAPERDGHNVDHICFRVAPFDAEAIVRHLRAHGADVGEVRSRYGSDGTATSIYLTDPEGNTIELKGPGDGKRPAPKETPA